MRIKYYYFTLPFLVDMAAGISLFCFPLYAKEFLNFGALQIGLIAGVLGCLYTCVNLFFEKIEKILQKNILIYLGLIMVAFSYLSVSFIRKTFMFVPVFSIAAIGHALFWPSFEAHLTLGKNEKIKKRNLGYFNLGWSTGLVIAGPLAGGFIYEFLGPKAFLLAGGIALAGLTLNIIPFKEDCHDAGDSPKNDTKKIFDTRLLYLIWFSNFLSFFIVNILRTFFPLLGLTLQMKPWFIGFILFLPGLAQILITLFLKNNPAWSYNLRHIILGQFLAISGMILVGLTNITIFIAIGLFLPGLMTGITNYSSNFMSLIEEKHGKKRIGIHEAVIGLAGTLSGFFGGGIAEALGLRAPYFLSAFILGGIIILELLILKKKQR